MYCSKPAIPIRLPISNNAAVQSQTAAKWSSPPPPPPYLRSQPSHLRRTRLDDPVAKVLELLIVVWQVVVRVYDILVGGEFLEVLAVLALQGCVMKICSVQVDGDEIGVGHDRQAWCGRGRPRCLRRGGWGCP